MHSEESDKEIISSSASSENSESLNEKALSEETLLEPVAVPPDGGWGWAVVIGAFVNMSILDGIFYSLGVFLSEYAGYYHRSIGATSLRSSLLIGSSYLFSPVSGSLVKIHGCRAVGIGSSMVSALALVLSIFCPNLEFMIITFAFFGGCSFGVMYLVTAVAVGQYFEKRRALAYGVALCGSGAGTLGIAPMSKYLLDIYGWKGTHLLLAGLLLQCCVTFALMRPVSLKVMLVEREEKIPEKLDLLCEENEEIGSHISFRSNTVIKSGSHTASRHELAVSLNKSNILLSGSAYNAIGCTSQLTMDTNNGTNSLDVIQKNDRLGCLKHLPGPVADVLAEIFDLTVLKSKGMAMLGIANVFIMFGCFVPVVFIVPKAEEIGISSTNAAFLLCLTGILCTLGRLLLSMLSTVPGVSPLIVNNISVTLSGLAVIALPFCTDYLTLAVAISLYGFFFSVVPCFLSVIICDLIGIEKLPNGLGIINIPRGLMAIAGPPITGKLVDLTGNYDITMFVGGGCLLIGGLLQFTLHLPYFKSNKRVT